VPLAAQNESTRSRTVSPAAESAGIFVSFAIEARAFRLLAPIRRR
jgi:hypothetical protein